MKRKTIFNLLAICGLGFALGVLLFNLSPTAKAQGAVGTAFTYQGRLFQSGSFVDGVTCNFQFGLYSSLASTTPLGTGIQSTSAPVSNGYFTVDLDFGSVFDGNQRYLEVAVQCPGDVGFTPLSGRIELKAAPYATSIPWSGITGRPAGLDDGDNDTLASLSCPAGQSIRWNGLAWVCDVFGFDHGGLAGLTDDDHPQYLLVDITTRALINDLDAGNNKITDLAAATTNGDAVRFEQAIKVGDTAGGDLNGTYPNPTVDGLRGRTVANTAPTNGQVLKWNGSAWVPATDVGATDHGALTGLGDDDHPQYLLADGTRALSGNLSAGNNKITNLAAATTNGDAVRFEQAIKVADTAGGDLNGTYPNPTVDGLRGRTVANTAPTNGQVLKWNGTAWAPAADNDTGASFSAGDGLNLTGTTFSVDVTDILGIGLSETANNINVNFGGNGTATTASRSDHTHNSLTSTSDATVLLDSDNNSITAEFVIYRNSVGAGNAAFRVTEAGDVFADGGYNCGNSLTASTYTVSSTLTITAVTESNLEAGPCLTDDSPADFAEMLPASKSQALEPGDVLVIGPAGELARSSEAYQPTVMGVYSTRPSYLGNAQYAKVEGYVPLAVVGVVPVKVSTENGPIQPGDMLVASSTPGHAMRCMELEQCFGRTIGKALSPLDHDVGLIRVLVTLQ